MKRLSLAAIKLGAIMVAALSVIAPGAAQAQAWPTKQPVKIISPYAPGGTTDILARLLAQRLGEKFGQTFIVENKGGAGGNIGTDAIAKAAPDGYSLLLAASGPIVIAPSLYGKLPYQPLRDFTYVAPVANASFVVVANAKSGLNSLSDVIAQGKQEGKLNFASAGSGTPQHIIGELLNQAAGTKIQHIPYKGSGPAMNDLIGGQVPMAIENPIVAMQHVQSGKLKVLAQTGEKRSASLPDVPTIAELGLRGFDAKPWYALLAPAGLPADITQQLNAAIAEILKQPAVKQRLEALGAEPMYMSPDQFRSYVAADLEKWTKVVKASGATLD